MEQYRKGRTPNPCIVCNREVKFKALFEFSQKHGFDKIATGHYAKIDTLGNSGKRVICRARDEKKDQSYMLWRLTQEIIDKLIFPLSDLTKDQIRTEASARGISAAEKRDSQEICFIPSGDYGEYIEERIGKCEAGDFVDPEGKVLGRHKGIIHYTVGQRKGLGIALGSRAFITDINPQNNRITLSLAATERDGFMISDIVFLGICEMSEGDFCSLEVKVRYQAPPVPCRVDFISSGRAKVTLLTPAKFVTSGQSAVFYDKNVLAFGGFID